MQLPAVVREALNSANVLVLDRDCEGQARTDGLVVDEHRAATADTVFTTDMSPRETQVAP